MKISWLIVLALFVVMIAGACQSSPAPAQDSYPAPEPTPTNAPILYPDAQDGDNIPWEQAQGMILNGEITKVMQSHALKVTIVHMDGRTFTAFEPEIDEVIKVIELCGDLCVNIVFATE